LFFKANIGDTRQGLPARVPHLLSSAMDCPVELWMRRRSLCHNDNIRPVAGRSKADGFPDPATGTGDQQRFSL
jgi:hypothetical protein